MFRVAKRRRLGIDRAVLLSNVGIAKHSQSLGISRHHTVLDTVVNHLDEVSGAVWPAVQVAQLGCAVEFLPSRGSRDVSSTGRQPLENWIEMFDHLLLAANHHA